ncbi:hypothetical protein [Nocardioides bizhenqiangii]|uniref:Uncharacterized protein n=1 Tax=Nocardioides bizhenqiangii TaxID=3095076 RepID=A0ABZ0ZJB3_9ACTN|nr:MULTISPECIES: hypothetical protein [unclassified Nocardioides]MDZ5620152.1 hypothetical protein [Nocardioides sp. HM23]MDZ5623439.1 hypothetical protein [Nocardioides sp. HM23]WQQ24530.1 hypothetical protein SHK19_11150 [Nocardioides sp. HM61]
MDGPQRIKQVTGLLADGTGLSDEELKFLVGSIVVTSVVSGALAIYVGVERFREFLRDG